MGHMPHKRDTVQEVNNESDQTGPMKGKNEHIGFVEYKEENDHFKKR